MLQASMGCIMFLMFEELHLIYTSARSPYQKIHLFNVKNQLLTKVTFLLEIINMHFPHVHKSDLISTGSEQI